MAAKQKRDVNHRVVEAIALLENSGVPESSSIQRVIDLLYSVHEDFQNQEVNRRLEDGKGAQDDDDYFSYWKTRSSASQEVSVTYDESDNTVVTVGDDVIVVIQHSLRYYLLNGMMVLTCIVLGATMAGLLMGIMSLDPLILGVKARKGETAMERRRALALIPFVQNKNLVLVSVLLVNCGVNESLPIFLEKLVDNPIFSVFLSLTVVLIVGEILPSAYFTGRDQIRSASNLIPVLRCVIILTAPISFPLAKLMDHYFSHGDEVSSFKRGEISALVRIQYEEHLAWKRRKAGGALNEPLADVGLNAPRKIIYGNTAATDPWDPCKVMCEPFAFITDTEDLMSCAPENNCIATTPTMHEDLGNDDIIKLEGALAMKDKKVEMFYTPMNRVVSVTADTILDEDMVVKIYGYGYSRMPVFSRDEIGMLGVRGVLLTKQLMLVRKEDKRRVGSLTLYEPPCVSPQSSLAETLSIILAGSRKSSNMALVCANPELARAALQRKQPVPVEAGVMGVITLENVLEELIQEQIYDEKDKKMKPSMERAKWAIAKWKAFTLRRRVEKEDEGVNDDDGAFAYAGMKDT